MARKFVMLATLALLGLGRAVAADDVHVEQAPAHRGALNSVPDYLVVADDFQLSEPASLQRLEWWGGYPDAVVPDSDDFIVTICADVDGQPGDICASYGPGLGASREATGESLAPPSDPFAPEFRYGFNLPEPLPLQPDTRYWLIIESPFESNLWAWELSASPSLPGLLVRLGSEWQAVPVVDPEPPPLQNMAWRLVLSRTGGPRDTDGDGRDDEVDSDPNNPFVCGDTDEDSCEDCATGTASVSQDGPDADADGRCDAADEDDDNDGVLDHADNCPLVLNPAQEDLDGDGVGSFCDGDHAGTCAAGAAQRPSHSSAVGSDGVNWTIADSVTVPRAGHLSRLTWWGGFDAAGSDALTERFIIRVYADAGGAPGALLRTVTPTAGVSKVRTGEPLLARLDPAPPPEYRYTFSPLAPVAVPAGQYWVGIGSPDNAALWLWSSSFGEGEPGLFNSAGGDPEAGPWTPVQGLDNVALSVLMAGAACTSDADADGVLDGEDQAPADAYACLDTDADLCDDCALGRFDPAADGADSDGDRLCDSGDPDDDADGVADQSDNCPALPNPAQADFDRDGLGDECDPDDDGDGAGDTTDNCRLVPNPGQEDADGDGSGDACDADDDADGVADGADLCPSTAVPERSVPTAGLRPGRYALVDGDLTFDTAGTSTEVFTTAATHGCSCEQILARSSGEKEGHYLHGCGGELLRQFSAAASATVSSRATAVDDARGRGPRPTARSSRSK